MQSEINNIDILLVGERGVGKTTLITRWTTGEYIQNHIPTTTEFKKSLLLSTNKGFIKVNFLEHSKTIPDGVIVVFSVDNMSSYKMVPSFFRPPFLHAIPIVIAGNKRDIKNRKVLENNIIYHRKIGANYFDISAKTYYGIKKPYFEIVKVVYGEDTKIREIFYIKGDNNNI